MLTSEKIKVEPSVIRMLKGASVTFKSRQDEGLVPIIIWIDAAPIENRIQHDPIISWDSK